MLAALNLEKQHDQIENVLRPGEHNCLYGQDKAFYFIASLARQNRLPQAFILQGVKGIGKATLAFHIIANLLSNGKEFHYVSQESLIWQQIIQQTHGNFLYIRPRYDHLTKNFRSSIGVEDVARIHNFLKQTPQDALAPRVILVDSLDEVTYQAANALLKILEEPPAGVLFLFICVDKGAILPTIRSRCQILTLPSLNSEDLIKALKAVLPANFDYNKQDMLTLAQLARGSVRMAALLLQSGLLKKIKIFENALKEAILPKETLLNLATELAQKDAQLQYTQFLYHILGLVAAYSKAEKSQIGKELWSKFYFAVQRDFRQANIYNLDKKTLILSTLQKMHAIIHGFSP